MKHFITLWLVVLLLFSCASADSHNGDQSSQAAENTEQANLYYENALSHAREGRFYEAGTEIDKAISLDQNNSEFYKIKGSILLDLRSIDESISAFAKSLEIDPLDAETYYQLGIACVFAEDMGTALSNWHKAVELDPSFVSAYYNLAMGYQELGDNQTAYDNYTKCIELMPEEALFYFERGRLQINMNYGKGAADLTKAIELEPEFAEAYWTRGFIMKIFMRNAEAAQADFDRAVEIDPRYRDRPYPNW
ncbi:tetratricopeptide repeat protein [Breznakiella homolactica]|uniref:Tetratricopeptide repeat protein n=1 Tax=Breznakiella homolactica TaxID=2798577 RepID=A0A7T8B911_9SPIR|nr:hypothetical protein [Breznakiella homolactica]QQO09154.1 hypothetical protein JFL75_19850 [Breznakiella homolactica]